ncbi:hypothetical protein AB835_07245 [Candidatus Endobugula sertula]|uniref:Endolytic peptidoglycan transglycosylase RlpA n=1 Tax=Candidatus Endobugula sertula TaxID=62101 RepID=A0A1D2QQG2_9GAMM|nr:hypothetical protein AB835_07245 [Candidatus Endobugula sertula]
MSCCRRYYFVVIVVLTLLVGACSTTVGVAPVEIDSTPTQDDAPSVDRDVSKIPDVIPQPVVRTQAGNKSPYTVFNKTYTLLPDSKGYQKRGYASWYGTKFHGRNTANGEVYDMWQMTAAHKTLPIPSYVRVTNVHSNTSVVVRVNDRGPFHSDRIIDLSYAAAKKLGFADSGVALVEVIDVTPNSFVSHPHIESSSSTFPVTSVSLPNMPTSAGLPSVKKTDPIALASSASIPVVEKTTIPPITLQVGTFKQKSSADRLKDKLAKILTVPVTVITGDNHWHRVHVGPITDKQTIKATKSRLSVNGIPSPYLIK